MRRGAPEGRKMGYGRWEMGDGRWEMGTKPLGSGAKGAWEGGLIIRGRRAKKS